MYKHIYTLWTFLRGVLKTPPYFLRTLSKLPVPSAIALCYTFKCKKTFFFFISLLKFILQQHPHYTSIWLSNIAPSYDKYVKTINGNTDHFYSMQFTASYSRKFLNLIIIHTLKKAKSYYLCQSNRNKCIEGLTCLPKDMLPEIFLSSHPTASATELACLTIN